MCADSISDYEIVVLPGQINSFLNLQMGDSLRVQVAQPVPGLGMVLIMQ